MGEYANGDHWTLDDIPLDRVETGRVRAREELFLLLAGASFVETATDLYTRNLTAQFHDDTEVSSWLTRYWEPEELQHGRALRAYVNHVWPDFDWQTAFSEFLAEHSRYCIAEELEPSPCLEMAARCVVEMGTATYYRAIQSISDEPVLQRLAGYIQRDEVRHYEHFHRYFNRLQRARAQRPRQSAGRPCAAPAGDPSQRRKAGRLVSLPHLARACHAQRPRIPSSDGAHHGADAKALSRADGHQDAPQAAGVAARRESPELRDGQTGAADDPALTTDAVRVHTWSHATLREDV